MMVLSQNIAYIAIFGKIPFVSIALCEFCGRKPVIIPIGINSVADDFN